MEGFEEECKEESFEEECKEKSGGIEGGSVKFRRESLLDDLDPCEALVGSIGFT